MIGDRVVSFFPIIMAYRFYQCSADDPKTYICARKFGMRVVYLPDFLCGANAALSFVRCFHTWLVSLWYAEIPVVRFVPWLTV
jgi:hypothetical protein